MASDNVIFSNTDSRLENLIEEFSHVDVDMEVKSEHDSEDEIDFSSAILYDGCELEFIIPEENKPTSVITENIDFSVARENLNLSLDSIEDSENIDVTDEQEVEIEDVTVRQELVEVAFDPSLLLYVNKEPTIAEHNKSLDNGSSREHLSSHLSETNLESKDQDEQLSDSGFCFPIEVPPALCLFNGKKNNPSVTAALRQVKRKFHNENFKPLNEIECPSDNVNNTQTSEEQRNRFDKLDKCHEDNENNDDNADVFSDPHTPCNSDFEYKELHQSVVTKRKRSCHKRSAIGNLLGKKKGKRKNIINTVQTKKLKHRSRHLKYKITSDNNFRISSNRQYSQKLQDEKSENTFNSSNSDHLECDKVINSDKESKKAITNKCKNVKKDKPSIFDEIKMDYTILDENAPKEKPKRIRKRDKKSKEMAAHNKPKSFDCKDCGKTFREKSHLATHARAHIDVRNFKCNRCGNLYKTKANLFFHMKTHTDTPFKCEKCNKIYEERRTLMRHIRAVHRFQNLYSCDQCGKEFKNPNNLNLHYTLHTGVKPYTCETCSKSFVYKSTYVAHMKSHNTSDSFNCELCPKTHNDTDFRRLCNHHSEARPWLCTVCGKGYPLKGTLKNHMKTHEPEKPFKCSECSKTFMKKQSYECHLKKHAGEGPQFMCDQCSQSYFNAFGLKRHYLKHTSERKFVCEVCSKAFWMKDALKVHMRTHTNIKMFQCSHCSKAFSHKHTLDAHTRTHLEVESFSCGVCQKMFTHRYNLLRHERQHLTSVNVPVVAPTVSSESNTVPISIVVLPPLASNTQSLNYQGSTQCF